MLGLDYSSGRPNAAAVVADGYSFVARYLDNGLGGRVNLTAAEVADMSSRSVAVAVVWESTADRATAGRDAGIADARAADVAVTAAGLPGLPIYFAIDFDVPDYAPSSTDPRAKLGTVADYFDGVVSVLGLNRTGVYGGYYAVSRALDAGLAAWAWQAAAWSGSQVDDRIHLYQHVGVVTVDGVECDVNESRKTEFGQHVPTVNPLGGNSMTTFITNTDTGVYATQDGPLVSGIRPEVEQATLKAWPGACCEIGLNDAEFQDRVNKSKGLEGLGANLAAVLAALQALPDAIGKAIPLSTGGLTADELAAAVTTGVRNGLSGVTVSESGTIAAPSTTATTTTPTA